MNYPTVLLVSVALGVDAFSVALSIGLAGIRNRQMLLVSGVVTLFHVFMPLLGLSLGNYLGNLAGPMASSLGALVLITIGLNTVWDNLKESGLIRGSAQRVPANIGRTAPVINIGSPLSLTLMAASVSLDALTVGFGLGTLKVDLLLTVLTMGLISGVMTAAGLLFGKSLNKSFGEKAGILGGIILVLIGIKLLVW